MAAKRKNRTKTPPPSLFGGGAYTTFLHLCIHVRKSKYDPRKDKMMKKKLKAFGIRSIASILTIVMVFNLLPLSVFAQENDSPTVVDESYKRLNEVFEVEELREETVKHFRLEDGSFVAAQYNNPVHYLDDNGQWQNIDNSLTIVGNEYTTGNGKIKFAKKITGNEELFTLHDGNHKVTMSMDNADKKTEGSIVKSKADDSDELTQLQKMMTLENLTAEVIYADIL